PRPGGRLRQGTGAVRQADRFLPSRPALVLGHASGSGARSRRRLLRALGVRLRDAEERHRAAVMAKAFASDAFPRIGASAIQVFGGVGFTWEHDVHLFYKRLLTLQECY